MKLIYTLPLLITVLLITSCQQKVDSFELKTGDLLFQDLDCGPFCEAIEKVTQGVHGAKLAHIGIYSEENYQGFVLEARSIGVVKTPIDSFLLRSEDIDKNPKVIVGRLNAGMADLIPDAIIAAEKKLGKPYDHIFDIENDAYYCSELVYHAFKTANNNKEVFHLFPMTFIDPDTDSTFGIWVDYYKDLESPIREGEKGLNPGGISRSAHIEIVHAFGKPDGYKL